MVKSRTQDLLSLPVCDEHWTFFYELEKADTPAQDPGRIQRTSYNPTHLFVQTALLYTTSDGEWRIRCHNLALPFTNNKSEPYEYVDTNSLVAFLMN